MAYTVASGDTYEGIAERFCTDVIYLQVVNEVRRKTESVYPGDVVNLDAYTARSVGDEDGVIFHNPEVDYLPPAR